MMKMRVIMTRRAWENSYPPATGHLMRLWAAAMRRETERSPPSLLCAQSVFDLQKWLAGETMMTMNQWQCPRNSIDCVAAVVAGNDDSDEVLARENQCTTKKTTAVWVVGMQLRQVARMTIETMAKTQRRQMTCNDRGTFSR